MSKLLAGLMVLLLSACASTPGGLRDDPSALRSFEIKAGYQTVLKRLVDQHENCTGGPLIPLGGYVFDVRNYPDLKVASIASGSSGFGTQIYLVIDLSEPTPGSTVMKVWSKIATDRIAKEKQRVAEGDLSCK